MPAKSRGWISLSLLVSVFVVVWGGYRYVFSMPGDSYRGTPPTLTSTQQKLKVNLKDHVEELAGRIGERNLQRKPGNLRESAQYLANQFGSYGYRVNKQTYTVNGETVANVVARLTSAQSRSDEYVVIGAHYDTVRGSPGANDNGSGLAALLEMSRILSSESLDRNVMFVGFANEEPPYFKTKDMGSYKMATRLKDENIPVRAMISLETIGYYDDKIDSQHYPPVLGYFYPDKGNFLGFVGNVWYGSLVREAIGYFRDHTSFPSEGITAPGFVPGVSWSDHQSFWKMNYPAIMVTDTALYRYPHYHLPSDTPDKVDYGKLARVTEGLVQVTKQLTKN